MTVGDDDANLRLISLLIQLAVLRQFEKGSALSVLKKANHCLREVRKKRCFRKRNYIMRVVPLCQDIFKARFGLFSNFEILKY